MDKLAKVFRPWMVGAAALAIFTCVIFTFPIKSAPPPQLGPNEKYSVKISNWLGHERYHCHHYKNEGNKWVLFDEDGEISGEFVITEGYRVVVSKK